MKATQLKKSISMMTILFATTSTMAAHADDNNNGNYQDYARVKNVTPEYQRVNSPRQDCRNEYIRDSGYDGYRGDRSTSDRSYTGTVVGGVAGALLGSRFGKGKGSTAATAVGAIAGAVIGDKVAANGGIFASNDGYRDRDHDYRDRDHDNRGREVQRCRTVDHYENRLTGYRVVYEYAGRNYTTVMQNQPGRQIPVQVSVVPTGEAARNTSGW